MSPAASATELRIYGPLAPHEDGSARRGLLVEHQDTGAALRLAGLRDYLHPRDAVAVFYPDLDYFRESAARDRENHGNEVYGPYATDAGLLGIVDMRPQTRGVIDVTDPALPDQWHPGERRVTVSRSRPAAAKLAQVNHTIPSFPGRSPG